MKKYQFLMGIAAFSLAGFTSCSDDDKTPDPLPGGNSAIVQDGAFFLNQGNMGKKLEGSLNVLNYSNGEMLKNVFYDANKRSLGNTPQCGVVYGGRIYLGIYESSTIEILDRYTFKSVKQIKLDNPDAGQSPRSIVADGKKVYISMYNGYVARLDTLTKEIDANVKVGPNPEIMAVHNGKLYVPNSDGMNWQSGYGTTASVITLSTFTVEKNITVPVNPYKFIVMDGNLYLHSRGDYGDNPAALYKMESDNKFTKIYDTTYVAGNDGIFYLIDAPWVDNAVYTYTKYDVAKKTTEKVNFENITAPSQTKWGHR